MASALAPSASAPSSSTHLGFTRQSPADLPILSPQASAGAQDLKALLRETAGISPAAAATLERVCRGSPALFAEIPTSALVGISNGCNRLSTALSLASNAAQRSPGVSSDPKRFAGQVPLQGPLSFAAYCAQVAPTNLSPLERYAAGFPVCSGDVVLFFSYTFEEARTLEGINRHRPPDDRLFSFLDRCNASGCPHLIPRWDLDEGSEFAHRPRWEGGPLKRICLGRSALSTLPNTDLATTVSASDQAWRFPAVLAVEAGVRLQLTSVKGSWRCSRSGISAWNVFVNSSFPRADSLGPDLAQLMAYSASFSNGDSLGKYLGSLRLALRLVDRPGLPSETVVAGLLRGARKHRTTSERPALRTKQVLSLIRLALDNKDVELARLLCIGRHFLFRVADELFPLQRAGRLGLPSDSEAWHSAVELGTNGSVTVVLRTRKNEPRGSRLLRSCVCRTQHPLLCGACSIRGLLQDSARLDGAPRSRLFASDPYPALLRLRGLCKLLDFDPSVGWHSLRRGMARDFLDSGASLATILRAGGWKSSAFLRYLCRKDVDTREATEFALADSSSDLD